MTDRAKQMIMIVVALGVAIGLLVWLWPSDTPPPAGPITPPAGNPSTQPQPPSSDPIAPTPPTPPQPSPPAPDDRGKAPQPPTDAAAAKAAVTRYEQGLAQMQAGNFFQARKVMSAALFSSNLPEATAAKARKYLTEMAEKTLLSPNVVDDKDPYVTRYTIQSGDLLQTIERRMALHVPTQLICKVNNITNPRHIQAGQTLKLVKGPFHAVVYLDSFIMDVYQKRRGDEYPYLFVKRFQIGSGKQGTTPVGRWRLKLGGKMVKLPWDPPPASGQRRRVQYGQPGYAFGTKGLWIALEGTDNTTKGMQGYGIHSTNDPSSIGKAESLGCIRMADDDIQWVFDTLYEKWSTVTIRK